MSEFNDIKKLWKSADSQIMANESLDLETVKQAITKLSIGITFKLLISIRAGIVALALSGLLFGYNIYGYSGNNLITILSISGLITSSLLFLYLISKYNSFNKLDQLGLSLQDLIVAKIHIFNKSLSLVHQAISIGLVLLVFSLNLSVDNDQGNYKVNNIWLYIGFLVIAYLISVLMLHLSHNLYLKQYRTALDDLNTFKLTKMDVELRKYKWIRLSFLTIILLGVLAAIIILFFKISGN